jgi:hypothetical protein
LDEKPPAPAGGFFSAVPADMAIHRGQKTVFLTPVNSLIIKVFFGGRELLQFKCGYEDETRSLDFAVPDNPVYI